jgi:predicted PurR-regulated permease PerM
VNNTSSRPVIYLVAVAALIVILFGVRGLASVINPILLAAVITITVLPIPGRLHKRGVPGWLSLVLTILMVVLILGLVILTVFFSITKLSTEVPAYAASASEQAAADVSSGAASTATPAPATSDTTTSTTSTTTTNASYEWGPLAQGFLQSLIDILVQFGIALAIFFFMISAAMALPGASRLGLDPNAPILQRISSLTEGVRKYMTVLTGINLLVGLGDTVFLMFLGVDYALLWGLLAWFMGYIPSVGFIIALIPPMIMAYAQYGWETAVTVLVGYILINGGVQNFIQPKVMGTNLRISPVVVFIGLFIWGFLLGGIGAMLAVPLTLLVLVIMENVEGTRPVAVLMRYTGEDKKEERAQAMEQVQGLWDKAKGTVLPAKDAKPDEDT